MEETEKQIEEWHEPVAEAVWMKDWKTFLRAWKATLKEAKFTMGYRPLASNTDYAKMKSVSMFVDRTEAFELAYKVLHATPFEWHFQSTFGKTLINAAIMAGQRIALLDDVIQLPTIWALRQEVFALFSSFVPSGSSGEHIKVWDGHKDAREINPSNTLLEYMPITHNNKSLGTSTARAINAPIAETANIKKMQQIIDIVCSDGLGCIKVGSDQKLDPSLAYTLKPFLTVHCNLFSEHVH